MQVHNCYKCTTLSKTRTNIVQGKGPLDAKIMFIGEAPGFNEDKLGEPFIGKAGAILNNLLSMSNLTRDNVYVTNAVKCRPINLEGGNRRPTDEELETCLPYLLTEIEEIKPELICTLGATPLLALEPEGVISLMHGRLFDRPYGKLIPLYHPASAIYNRDLYPIQLEDMKFVAESLAKMEG